MYFRYLLTAALALPCHAVLAQDIPKAIIALVGDADVFTIGQEGYCGKHTDIDSPSNKQFKIPAGVNTYFHIQSKMHVPLGTYTCSGDYSFKPSAGMLHIIRYTFSGNQCMLEIFKSEPGGTPQLTGVHRELPRSCLLDN